MAIIGNTRKLKKPVFWFLVAGVSPAVYFLSFHPATGSAVGIIFLFTAWLLPSLSLFSFSFAVVLLFNMAGVLKNAVAVLCLFLFLGALPGLIGASTGQAPPGRVWVLPRGDYSECGGPAPAACFGRIVG